MASPRRTVVSRAVAGGDPGLTHPRFLPRMPPVSWFRSIVALVLLALWVPATSHCAIETALGVAADECSFGTCACPPSTDDHADHPASDACAVLESGTYKPAVAALVAPAPNLTILTCLSRMHEALLAGATPLAPPAWGGGHPDDWLPMRHIATRAVAPARAPGLI